MEKHKEIGYELGDIYWHNLDGFQELWKKADFDTKEKCVNGIGLLALELCKNEPIINKRLAENLKIRDEECVTLICQNIRLRKYRNQYRTLSILLLLICVVLILMGNYLV